MQFEGVQALILVAQLALALCGDRADEQQVRVGRFGRVVPAFPFGSFAPFLNQFHRRQEKVVQRTPHFGEEFVDEGRHLRFFIWWLN